MQLTDIKGKVDFGLITIREDEFKAVLRHFPSEGRVIGQRHYNLCRVPLPGGGAYRIAVLRCIEQGNGEAQSAARDLLEDLAPHWLLVVGIGGGVPSEEFGLGDVVVSTRIHDFSLEAALQDRETEFSLAGGPVEKPAAALAANLPALQDELGDWHSAEVVGVPRPDIHVASASFYGDERWQQRVRTSLLIHGQRKSPLVTAGPIASSDKLIKDADLLTVWTRVARHMLAIEMESAGVYRATYGRQVPTLSIRGISDVVGLVRDPAWTRYACHTAAAFALALMRTRPFEPVSLPVQGARVPKLRSLVNQWPFPHVQDADPYHLLGVTDSEIARSYVGEEERPPYVPRDVDAELDKALKTHDLTLLVGHSKSGKSRTAFEAIARLYPQSPLIIPSNAEALSELLRMDPPLEWGPEPAILWLDELQRFLGPHGLTISLLNHLPPERGHVKLIATLTAQRYDAYLGSVSDVDKDVEFLLRRFREVRLTSELNAAEAQRAHVLYPNEPVDRMTVGLGEHLVAARELLRRYDTAQVTCPMGHALVRAAIDWRRAGLLRPIPEKALHSLTPLYVNLLKLPHVDPTPESLQEGLKWARHPVALHIALLSNAGGEAGQRHFEPFDYLIDHTDRMAVSIPDDAWLTILGVASAEESMAVGVSAYHRRNRAIAERALNQAIQSRDSQFMPRAWCLLGIVLQEEGRLVEAADAYRAAISSSSDEIADLARVTLGELLQKQGYLTEAESHLRRAMNSQHPEFAELAASNLGILHLLRGELADAGPLLKQALKSQNARTRSVARLNIAKLFMETGELDEAERVLQEVTKSDNPHEVAKGAVNLGLLQYFKGDQKEAERLYRQALDSVEPEVSALAMNNLGQLLVARGELAEAERLFRQAADSHQPYVSSLAMSNLALAYIQRGALDLAEHLYSQMLTSQEPLAAAFGANGLGLLRERQGQQDEARRLFQQAVDSGHADIVPVALTYLGSLLHDQGEPDAAVALLRRALQFKTNAARLKTKALLGLILLEQDETTEAESLLREVMETNQPELSGMSTLALAKHYNSEGRVDEAERVLRRQLAPSPQDDERPISPSEAYQFQGTARTTLLHEINCVIKLHLGKLLLRQGDTVEAIQLLEAALTSSDADTVTEARAALAQGKGVSEVPDS